MSDIESVPEAIRKEIASLPRGFYGNVEITYQNGIPVTIKTTAVEKLDKLNQQLRGDRYANDRFNR